MAASSNSAAAGILDLTEGGLPTSAGQSALVSSTIWIEGRASPAALGGTFETVDPSTRQAIAAVSRGTAEDVDRAIESARKALKGPWGRMTPQERGNLLLKLADAIDANTERLASLETADTGKPLNASRGDMTGAAATLRYNAGAADKLEGGTIPLGAGFVDFTELEPVGVTAHITPWNFPLGMAVRSLAPALSAGCTAVLKPAEQAPLSTVALAGLALDSGFPPGAVNVVTGFGEEAGAALAGHADVDSVTFTGSVETGRKVAAAAGSALTPVVLELGGKNPMMVFDDADLDQAVDAAIEGAFDNTGQVCSSVSRLLLQQGIADPFLELFVRRAELLKVERGADDGDLGPLASGEQFAKVHGHIELARQAGAQFLLDGTRSVGPGYFIGPTVIDGLAADSPVATEETFGPVVTVFRFETEDEAAAMANSLPYGLSAGIQTRDIGRALRLARLIDAGTVWINGWFIGGVQAPTGGVKNSGFGRERGQAGIQNYLRIKNIGIDLGLPP